MHRRSFIQRCSKYGIAFGSSILMPSAVLSMYGDDLSQLQKLTILHTNDVHSRIEPFPLDGSKYSGRGGFAKRAAIIQKIRIEEKHVLLLDAGDMFQGTPYFNYFGGELEMKLMSKMKYDVATLGNHDFDAGIEGLYNQYSQHGAFTLVNCNYDFNDTIMNGQVLQYKIIQKGAIKIGITGVGIELEGLVPKALYRETRYHEPTTPLNKTALFLKQEAKCDYVICLSHLGYKSKKNRISDLDLARSTSNVDLIIGGHSHTFLDQPTSIVNKVGEEILVTQVGWAGLILGRLDVYFRPTKQKQAANSRNILVD